MEQYFIKEYHGTPFELFGTAHLIALGIIASVCLSFVYFRKVWDENARRTFRYSLAILMIVAEISWHWWVLVYDKWTIQKMLPLHLCSVFIWLSIYMLFTKNRTVFELAYFIGLGGAIQALLTPDAGIYGFPHFRAFQTFADHGGLFIAALYMALVEGYRPTLLSFKRVFLWINVFMMFVFIVNQIIGSNYMYVAHKPEFPSLIDLLSPWPWYILELEGIAFLICGILYLPYGIKDWMAGNYSRQAADA
jgi:hypothetical integral membrane protein (TIGR02206 family)